MQHDIVLAVGGTGGHLIPAMHICKELGSDFKIAYAGVGLSQHEIKGEFKSVSGAGPNRKHMMQSSVLLCRGVYESMQYLKQTKPKLVIGFGSFHSFPVIAAARLLKIPYILYEPNQIPGRVNRFFASKALFTASLYPTMQKTPKGKREVITPLIPMTKWEKGVAREKLGLEKEQRTLLSFGGSQGAMALNQAMLDYAVIGRENLQVIHLIGRAHDPKPYQDLYRKEGVLAYVKSYEENMDLVWSAADIALCRAGANTVMEMIEYRVPAILVPYPHARDQHQRANAEWMEKTIKGGIMIENNVLNAESIQRGIQTILDDYDQYWKQLSKYHAQIESCEFKDLIREVYSRL
ncbi:MAG: UDP-N-acetylglucosamine--N-acetylmuramyl-(pentapeptide) pyrophosphoryl-undecaprenol N-acetylglucosamine transferase [Simkaniaceae bacterium]|nr:UDP-N-acetylglucosamine--N-acetylmuramyl-(pentapeptide) pyrophosphoryl-undecaprenol N-acetylglucosamine transferase [Simkaniaceae bacterium]MCF7852090.1 UDP-N-acetylglucosamine--N-acetylmuramyl-(pentapeptide) pyrophosphoryl-undecaprenol N-acetylglucosamine transferase [Simkaniaceae bacterium]